ncbi:MAG: STAS domain-containing protein [Eggerthellaceae bacterium]|nr:STAS domain-containing protein [Eggerthellaceae bacterium]
MDYSVEKTGQTVTIKPQGALNAITVPEVEDAFMAELDGAAELVMDLSELENISSMGLRLLLTLYRRMEKQGAMRIENAQGNVAEVLEMTGFAAVF